MIKLFNFFVKLSFKKSKGGILEKTVLYLSHMKLLNQKLAEQVFSLEKLKQESDLLKLQVEITISKKLERVLIVKGDI